LTNSKKKFWVKFILRNLFKNKSKIALFVLTLLLLSGLVFSMTNIFKIPTDINSDTNISEEKDEPMNTFSPSISGGVDFSSATKTILHGTQDDPPFDDNNIKLDDSLIDSTTFTAGYKSYDHRDVADYGVVGYTGAFGSTDAGLWYFTNAYKDNDGKYLYLETTWGNQYPGTISMKWGAYSNIPSGAHTYVRRIRVFYEVWADSFVGILDHSTNLRLVVHDDIGNTLTHTIATNPIDDHHYESYTFITSGAVFNRVKAGGYIKYLEVKMYANEELWTYTWINVDYVDIYYDYHMPDVDFYYELDYGALGLTTVSEFRIWFDVTEYITGTNVWLYDYDTPQWVQVGSITNTGWNNILITSNAEKYFSQSDKLAVRFSKYDYWNGNPYTSYRIKIDQIEIAIPEPEKPSNVQVEQGILHIFLSWDPSSVYGAPVTHYNIYRGTVMGGAKTLHATSPTNEYNDTSVVVGTKYYYTISASSVAGESDNSTEVSGQAWDQPFVSWTSPEENATIIFPKGEPVTFHFDYDWGEIDDVELVIEKGMFSVNHSSVWNETSIDIYEGSYLDGYVTATLYGYNNSVLMATDTRHFTFVKIILEVGSTINSSTEILGKQLYLILHDPHGDNSFSYFSESTTLSFGVGCEIKTAMGMSVEIGDSFELFGVESGASVLLSFKTTMEAGFDFRYEMTDSSTVSSSRVTDNADYIGPGYGDRYWGEAWIYKWVLNATYRVYSNGTDRWEDPQLFYGIIRDVETYCSDEHAPQNWRDQNAVYNHSMPIQWMAPVQHSGGAPWQYEFEVTSTETRKTSIEIELGSDFALIFPGVETHIEIEMSMKNYAEMGQSTTHKVGYELYDDDPTDFIVQGVGIDKTFGTYIFNTTSFFCETSLPYEHGTYDYLPPAIDFPEIDLDVNEDGFAPTPDESPEVTVDIFEEGGIQEAIIWYSTDNGSLWQISYLTEQPLNPGTWQGTIPEQPFNTTVLWYIQAWDNQGNNATRKDNFGNPFEYTVVEKPKELEATGIPGYSFVTMIPITIVAVASVGIIIYQKNRKK